MESSDLPAPTGESGITGSLQIQSIDDVSRIAQMMSKSGFFDDAKSAAQAGVKILAGMELGIPPVASVRGVYILDGNTCLSSGLLAALIKQHPRYDYKVVTATDEECELAFYENGEKQGTASFTMEEARSISHGDKTLAEKDNWQNYQSDMLFSRALSRGRRRFCPDIGNGLYTPDEMGAVTDKEGHVVEAEVVEETTTDQPSGKTSGTGQKTDPSPPSTKSTSEQESQDTSSQSQRSASGETKSPQNGGAEKATDTDGGNDGNDYDGLPFEAPKKPPAQMVRRFHALGTEAYDDWDEKRPELVEAVTDGRSDSSADLTTEELQHLIDGIEEKLDEPEMIG
jgi:hypothetical protein